MARATGEGKLRIRSYTEAYAYLANRLARGQFIRNLPGRDTVLKMYRPSASSENHLPCISVIYRGNIILRYYPAHDGLPESIRVYNAGYRTITTKRRLNQYLPDGIKIISRTILVRGLFNTSPMRKAVQWYLVIGDKQHPFREGMTMYFHVEGK